VWVGICIRDFLKHLIENVGFLMFWIVGELTMVYYNFSIISFISVRSFSKSFLIIVQTIS